MSLPWSSCPAPFSPCCPVPANRTQVECTVLNKIIQAKAFHAQTKLHQMASVLIESSVHDKHWRKLISMHTSHLSCHFGACSSPSCTQKQTPHRQGQQHCTEEEARDADCSAATHRHLRIVKQSPDLVLALRQLVALKLLGSCTLLGCGVMNKQEWNRSERLSLRP